MKHSFDLLKIAIKNKKIILNCKPPDESKLIQLLDNYFQKYYLSINELGKIKVSAEIIKDKEFAAVDFFVPNCNPYYREKGLIHAFVE